MPVALRIAGYLRKYPLFAIGTLAAAFVSTILGLIYPRLTGYLIDDVIAKGQADRLGWLIGLLVLVFMGRDGLNALRILLNNVFELVRLIATTRIALPRARIRLSAGRTALTREAQALCFFAGANSIFFGDKLLTASNPDESDDRLLLKTLGLLTD